jgi:hypothetical protein
MALVISGKDALGELLCGFLKATKARRFALNARVLHHEQSELGWGHGMQKHG